MYGSDSYAFTHIINSAGSGFEGGGDAGSPSVTSNGGRANVHPLTGGMVKMGSEAAIDIPAGALSGTSGVEVRIEKISNSPKVPAGFLSQGQCYQFTVDGQNHYSFNKPVTLSFKFDPAALAPGETPAVYYYDEARNQWVNVGGMVSDNTITVVIDHFTKFAVLAEKKAETKPQTPSAKIEIGFTDLSNHWAKDAILALVDKKAIGGYPDKTFKPERTMTRTEFIVALTNAFGLKIDNPCVLKFKDAKTIPVWGKGSVAAADKVGIIPTVWGSNFSPNTKVTRADMAYMIGKVLKAKVISKPRLYFKDKIPAWAASYVAYSADHGIMSGYKDKTFKSYKAATRAEACTVIANGITK